MAPVTILRGGGFRISKEIRAHGIAKVLNTMTVYKLDTWSPKIAIKGRNTKTGEMGTDSAMTSSIARCETIWRLFRDFCLLVGDYESAMLPDRDTCPKNPFPVKLDTAMQYIQCRTCKKGEILKHNRTDEPVKDIHRNELKCLGDWRGQSSVALFRTAQAPQALRYHQRRVP